MVVKLRSSVRHRGSNVPRCRRAERNGLGLPWSHRHHDHVKRKAVTCFAAVRRCVETPTEVEDRQARMLGRMARTPAVRSLCRDLERCRRWRRCCSPHCKHCSRLYRLWMAPQVVSLSQEIARPTILTLNLKEVACGRLADIDLRLEKDALRQRLRRAGIDAAIGNMEVAYKPERDSWGLGAHIIVFGLRRSALEQLRASLSAPRAVMVQALAKPVRQITYLFKFVTYYHHPSSRRSLPLPDVQLVELAAWRARSTFADHTILVGFQRGGIIVPAGAARQ